MLTVLHGHCITELRKLPAASVHCVVTSPPYWGLRDYKTPTVEWEAVSFASMPSLPEISIPAWTGHLGLEPDPMAFVGHIVAVFREVRRVLRKDGTLWLNFGDCYASNAGGYDQNGSPGITSSSRISRSAQAAVVKDKSRMKNSGLKEKDMAGMPWRIAFALQADGWYLRTDIIWHKPTVMPESVTDRPTKAHEYVFLLTVSPQYFYDADAIKEEASRQTNARGPQTSTGVGFGHGFDEVQKPRVKGRVAGVNPKAEENAFGSKQNSSFSAAVADAVEFRNKRTVWSISDHLALVSWLSQNGHRDLLDEYFISLKQAEHKPDVWTIRSEPFHEAHFATFPKALVRPCILAGTSAHGVCSACGAPWKRVTEKVKGDPPSHAGSSFAKGKTKAAVEQTGRPVSEVQRTVSTSTVGWQPTCPCEGATVVPALVGDPFLGSGTTAQVAIELGRHAMGVELGEHHLPLIARRTDTTPGLALS